MRVRVMRHLVPGGGDRPDEFRVDGRFFPDHKKRREGAVCRQEFENARGVFRVGTVVNGQPHLPPRGCEAPVHAHQSLCLGCEQMVSQQRIGPKPKRKGYGGRRPSHEDGRDFAGQINDNQEPHVAIMFPCFRLLKPALSGIQA